MNTNRLLVLSFKNSNDDTTRDSFEEYYMPLVETKDFNELTDNKQFLISQQKTNKNQLQNLLKCQEVMIIKQEIYWTVYVSKIL